MKTYYYEGTDDNFQPCSGELQAPSETEARKQLEQENIRVRVLSQKPVDEPLMDLSQSEAVEVREQVETLIGSGLPLAEGLRAAADEFQEPGFLATLNALFFARSNARIRSALIQTANAVERGKPIDEILNSRVGRNEIGAILKSGISSESAAMAVGEYSAYVRSSTRLRSHVIFLFAYPIVVATLAAVLLAAFMVFLIPEMRDVFDDFGTELPALTEAVIGVSERLVLLGPRFVLVAPLLFVTALVVSVARGRWARRLLGWLPLIGTSFRSVDLSRMAHLLAIVLRHQAPVPSALRAAGSAVEDCGIRNACVAVADHIDNCLLYTSPSPRD